MYLSSFFEKVVIFPLQNEAGKLRQVPANVEVEFLFGDKSEMPYQIKDVFKMLDVLMYELSYQPVKTLNYFRYNVSFLKSQYSKAKITDNYLKKYYSKGDVVLYSYWFDTWSLILSLVKKIHRYQLFNFHSRAHGFDVFEDQTLHMYHPFKNFMLENIRSVYSVSEKGKRHLQNRFPRFHQKIKRLYLGSPFFPFHDMAAENELVIASCADVRDIKRLDLVPKILKQLPAAFKVKWVLIGGGQMLEQVKESCRSLGNNITCVFTGHLPPAEVIGYYATHRVDLFLSVSRSEGLPFTMMEAISFGIPLMSTDVGGCSEICNEKTGILIHKDFDVKDVAKQIVAFSESKMNTSEFRKGVRKFWEDNFNAEKNYEQFYKEISSE